MTFEWRFVINRVTGLRLARKLEFKGCEYGNGRVKVKGITFIFDRSSERSAPVDPLTTSDRGREAVRLV